MSNITPALVIACRELEKAMKGTLDGTKLQEIQDTINGFAIASAVACFFSGIVPGAAGVVAMLAQAGFVWATYLSINRILGLSFSENVIKTIASAILTNQSHSTQFPKYENFLKRVTIKNADVQTINTAVDKFKKLIKSKRLDKIKGEINGRNN